MVAAVERIKEMIHPSQKSGEHEFQGTVHFQFTTPARDSHDAQEKMAQQVRDALSQAGIRPNAFNIPLVRDMDEESDNAQKQYTTVLVAVEVAAPSEGTAFCVANEMVGEAMSASDADQYAAQYATAITYNNEQAEHYNREIQHRLETGVAADVDRMQGYVQSYRAAAATATEALELVNKVRGGRMSQGMVTNYTVLGYSAGQRMGDVIPSQAVPSGN